MARFNWVLGHADIHCRGIMVSNSRPNNLYTTISDLLRISLPGVGLGT